eukprot:1281823-Pyramimonas_sp.AAC.1
MSNLALATSGSCGIRMSGNIFLSSSTRSGLGSGSGDVSDGDPHSSSSSSPRGTCALSLPNARARPP